MKHLDFGPDVPTDEYLTTLSRLSDQAYRDRQDMHVRTAPVPDRSQPAEPKKRTRKAAK